MFHQYWQSQCKSKELMADISANLNETIKETVKKVYLADVQAIRNLSEVANKIQKEGLVIAGNLEVRGQILANKDIISDGDIKSKKEISNSKYTLSSVQDSLDTTVKSVNKNFGAISSSLQGINLGIPVSVRFIAKDPNINIVSIEFVFLMDSELLLVWHDGNTLPVRNKVVDKAKRLGYSLPLSRVKTTPHSWDFRPWNSFVLSIPQGKVVRIFSWGNSSNNDMTYTSGVHYVQNLNLYDGTEGYGFHSMWAGLDSKKYELIPKGYNTKQMRDNL